ncbi:MAG: hypothetical protein C0405_12150, partial [Desulfovibrio sp.]|nr:hypothetical protein [Desulfovibrio sp.]
QAVNSMAQALWYAFDPPGQEARARRALDLDPTLAGATWLLAQALDRQNKPQQAEPLLAGLLARDPQHSLALQSLGGLEMDRAPAQAQARLEKALLLDPGNSDARFNLALVLRRAGRAAEAEAELDKLLAADAKDASALNLRGQLQQEQGRAAQARQSFEAATRIAPGHVGAWYNLGALCAGPLKDPACARAAFTRFLELEPGGPRAQKVRDWLARSGN